MIKHTSDNDFEKDVMGNDKLVLVDFFATWCMPCKMLAPVFEEMSNKYEDVDFFKIDIDQNPDLVQKFSIESVPTLVLFRNGEIIQQEIGVRSERELSEIIEKIK